MYGMPFLAFGAVLLHVHTRVQTRVERLLDTPMVCLCPLGKQLQLHG